MHKICLSLISVIVIFSSCSTNEVYYKEPINKWLENNLHDYSSYESVSFEIIDSGNEFNEYFPSLSSQYSNFENVSQRKLDLIPNIVNQLKGDIKKEKLNEIIELRRKLSSIDSLELANINKIIVLHDSLDKKVKEIIELKKKNSSLNESMRQLSAQYEGITNRFKREKDRLSHELENVGLSMNNINQFIDEGLIIFHKFRANNQVGAKVLNRRIFVLDTTKSEVKVTIEI